MSKAFKMPFSAATIAAAIFGSCLTASSASAAEWNWVNATPDRIPPDAVVGGSDYPGHEKLYICRANYQNGIHPGKVRPGFRGCNITYAGEEKTVPDFQVLVSSWVPASNGSVPPHASALGHEAGGDPLYVCRVNYQGGEHSGKVRPGLGGCFFGYAGNEVKLTDYEVLTTPAIAMATNPRLSPVYETLAVGTESGKLMWICTAEYQGGVHPGKMREDFHACNIGWGTKEIQADPQHFHVDLWGARWLSNEEIELNLGTLFEAGKQGDGVPLYICRDLLPPEARAGGSHPGKYRKDGTCFIGYAGKEYIGGGSARSRLRQPSFGRAAETSLIQTCLPRRRRARGNSSTCVVTRITRAKCVRRYNHDARHRGPNKAGDAMRIFLFAAALALLPLPAGAVDGFNMPGDDYANFPAGSAFVCRNTCGGESRCQGWTWVKPGLQGPAGHCWLKSSIPLPPLVKDDCCSSGSHENIDARDLTAENRTNRWGSDYTNFDSDGWESCQAACAGQDRCASWSYVQPGVQGPSGRCWLKTIVARPSDDANVISGVKFRPRAGKFD